MDNNKGNSAVVPIRAHLSGIEVVGDLEGTGTSKRRDHFVIISIDDREVMKSEKKSRLPTPRWEWPEEQKLLFHPSSTIKITVYRESRTHLTKYLVGQHTGQVAELLDNNATITLKDKAGAGISSDVKIRIDLSLVPEPEDTFKSFMKTVDDDVSRLKSILEQANTPGLDVLNGALELTKNIIDVVAGTHPFVKIPFTIMSAAYKAVQQAGVLDDAVRGLAKNLRETLGIAEKKPDLLLIEDTDNVIEEIGRTSLKVASLIHEYTRLRFAGRVIKYQLSDDMKSRIEKCQKSCDDLKQKFDRRVNLDTNRQLKIIKDVQQVNNIRQWLAAPDSSRNYNEAREKHQKDTCSWFLNGERFREFQEKAGFLWIKGKAGSGKTILCSSIIDEVKQLRKEKPSITYAYFFFDGRDSQNDLQLHHKLIRSLILQLTLQCDGIPAPLVDLYGQGYQQPSISSLEDIFYHIVDRLPSTFIIIDSLDECTERQKTLNWIKQIFARKISTLHMVVVSRPERDIKDVLEPLNVHCIDLATESSNHDIAMYLDQQLASVKKWDEETTNIIKSTLTNRSEGMFRWVALQLIELRKCSNRDSVIAQLNSLPSGLYETYDRMLLKVSESSHKDTKIFLRWLCFSVRPMRLSEIAEAVVVDLDAENGPQYIPSRRYWDKKDVLEKCAGLIIESKETIKLAHFSIKEYLLSNHLSAITSLDFHLTTVKSCHSLISQTCLAYLLQFDADNSIDRNLTNSFPLAHYAAEHWTFHAKAGDIDESDSSPTLSLATNLFTHTGAIFRNWVQIWNLDVPYKYHKHHSIGSPLYYASLAGLQQLCLHLVKVVGVNAQGGQYGNALQAASYYRNEGIVKMLLENGADPNAQGGEFGNALQAASYNREEGIVKVLLENGADPNAQGGEFGNALQAAVASYNGNEGIVKVLLENGADPNAQGGPFDNALRAALYKGKEGIVKVLLENGADLNAQGGRYGNVLQEASYNGEERIVKVLLENGVDPSTQGGEFGNALQAASYNGKEGIVKVLLENGADPNAQGGHFGNALQAASYNNEGIVKVLLENGADPNAPGGYFGNALQAASCNGNEGIVKVLLENGADPSAQGGKYGNALQAAAASYKGNEGIVEVLLEHGADANAQGGEYGNALQAASFKGNKAIVKVLLKNGADPNAQGAKYGNALRAASLRQHKA